MKLYIKNMVCIRCKMIVKDELSRLGLHYTIVELGEAVIMENNITEAQHNKIKIALLKWGLELMDDKKAVLIERNRAGCSKIILAIRLKACFALAVIMGI